jgi:type III secretion system YscQ/HrcQ family protein
MTRSEVAAIRRCARALPLGALAALAEEARTWLGAPIHLEPLPLEYCPRGELACCLADPLVAAILESAAPVRRGRIAVELEPRFAAIVIDRVLGGTGADAPLDPGVLTDVERGVLGYAFARAIASTAGGSLRLVSVVTSSAALMCALGAGDILCWPGQAKLGPDGGIVRVWIPESFAMRGDPAPPGPHAASLGALRVTVVLSGGRATLRAAEVGALAPGDVVVLDEAPFRRHRDGTMSGEVYAHVRGGSTRWICDVEEERFMVKSIDVGAISAPGKAVGRKENRAMETQDSKERADALLRTAGDVPIELVVELARFEMPLAELAALRPGEVLGTGRAIGARVALRAGERMVALGELVDIDGEIGVRVLALG